MRRLIINHINDTHTHTHTHTQISCRPRGHSVRRLSDAIHSAAEHIAVTNDEYTDENVHDNVTAPFVDAICT